MESITINKEFVWTGKTLENTSFVTAGVSDSSITLTFDTKLADL